MTDNNINENELTNSDKNINTPQNEDDAPIQQELTGETHISEEAMPSDEVELKQEDAVKNDAEETEEPEEHNEADDVSPSGVEITAGLLINNNEQEFTKVHDIPDSNDDMFTKTGEIAFMKKINKRKKSLERTSSGVKKAPSKRKVITGVIIGLIALVIVPLSIIFGVKLYATLFAKPAAHKDNVTSEGHLKQSSSSGVVADELKENSYTFLAVATDKNGGLTDIIMVANYDIDNQKVSLLQIPRDTYVTVSTKLYYDKAVITKQNFTKENNEYAKGIKINEVYFTGKKLSEKLIKDLLTECYGKNDAQIERLCSESEKYSVLGITKDQVKEYLGESNSSKKKALIEDFKCNFGVKYLSDLIYNCFGIPIHYHARVNINGFRNIVDAIGGVELTVPQRMQYSDPDQDLYIDLYPGKQVLNGKKAEEFVRFRSGYVRADLDRLDAQKMFMTAFLKKMFSPSTIPKIPTVIEEITKNLDTNVSLMDMLDLANDFMGLIDKGLGENMTMTTLPGTDIWINGGSYYTVDKDAYIKLVNESFNVRTGDLTSKDFLLIQLDKTSKPSTSVTVDEIEDGLPIQFVPENEEEENEENSDGDENGTDSSEEDTEVDVNTDDIEDGEITDISENTDNSESSGNSGNVDNENNSDSPDNTENEDSTVSEPEEDLMSSLIGER